MRLIAKEVDFRRAAECFERKPEFVGDAFGGTAACHKKISFFPTRGSVLRLELLKDGLQFSIG
ncbi:hypothetical protein HFO49_36505 [Rhizobium leguminosarum]|uniref:hypothetical protein n=1 Tax=Rhizobium leguminosarum TaxID=384 RepID=UPI001C9515AB|nr:hypothetical protein [Rhizobium leguminosarum]MBY5592828.1 hypothetical protein [Rhizobium leguminosarum]